VDRTEFDNLYTQTAQQKLFQRPVYRRTTKKSVKASAKATKTPPEPPSTSPDASASKAPAMSTMAPAKSTKASARPTQSITRARTVTSSGSNPTPQQRLDDISSQLETLQLEHHRLKQEVSSHITSAIKHNLHLGLAISRLTPNALPTQHLADMKQDHANLSQSLGAVDRLSSKSPPQEKLSAKRRRHT
jgi:hypothetical protein